jgi:hypothetical protein
MCKRKQNARHQNAKELYQVLVLVAFENAEQEQQNYKCNAG